MNIKLLDNMNQQVKSLLDSWEIPYYYHEEDNFNSIYENITEYSYKRIIYSFLGYPFIIELATKLPHRTHKQRLLGHYQYLFRWSPKTKNRTLKTLERAIERSGLLDAQAVKST